MPNITLRPSFSKDLDALRRSSRKQYLRACEILIEIQRGQEPSAHRRADTRIPKCFKYELPDGYRLVLQRGDKEGVMVALAVGTHDQVDSFLDGHRGYVFNEKTGHLRELRIGTATESAVEMVPSEALLDEQQQVEVAREPLFDAFTDDMLRHLGVPESDLAEVRGLDDPNGFECMVMLQAMAEVAPEAADALLAFTTGDSATRQTVIDLALGNASFSEDFPEVAVEQTRYVSEEFLTFKDPEALNEVLERGTLRQWQLFLHPEQRSLVERAFRARHGFEALAVQEKRSSRFIAHDA